MAHRPGHSAGGGSRRGQFGRSQGGGADRAGNRYRDAGGVAGGYGEVPRGGGQKINIPFGLLGGGGGGRKNIGYAQADYDRQMALMDKIGEMTTPWSTYGTLGETIVDAEGKKVTQTLSPQLQEQYDALLQRAQLTGQRVGDLSLDPLSLQNKIYQEQQALLQPEQDEARAAMDEQLFARGMLGSTGGAAQRGGLEASIGGQNQQLLANALAQSQGILDAERGRQSMDMSNALTMAGQQNQMMGYGAQYGQGISVGNVAGVSGSSANIANQLAVGDATKRKGLWDMLGMGGTSGSGSSGNLMNLIGLFT